MEETNLTQCKKCGQLKQRTRAGNFGIKNKRYVDEHGLNWNGKTCGVCNLDRVRNAMKNLRDKRTAPPQEAAAKAE